MRPTFNPEASPHPLGSELQGLGYFRKSLRQKREAPPSPQVWPLETLPRMGKCVPAWAKEICVQRGWDRIGSLLGTGPHALPRGEPGAVSLPPAPLTAAFRPGHTTPPQTPTFKQAVRSVSSRRPGLEGRAPPDPRRGGGMGSSLGFWGWEPRKDGVGGCGRKEGSFPL